VKHPRNFQELPMINCTQQQDRAELVTNLQFETILKSTRVQRLQCHSLKLEFTRCVHSSAKPIQQEEGFAKTTVLQLEAECEDSKNLLGIATCRCQATAKNNTVRQNWKENKFSSLESADTLNIRFLVHVHVQIQVKVPLRFLVDINSNSSGTCRSDCNYSCSQT